jgi:hypothetical protein
MTLRSFRILIADIQVVEMERPKGLRRDLAPLIRHIDILIAQDGQQARAPYIIGDGAATLAMINHEKNSVRVYFGCQVESIHLT